jgi:SAM-dependent methyltransferase
MFTENLASARARLTSGAVPKPAPQDVFVGDGDYVAIAAEFLDYFVTIGGLEPHHRVLDIGCGIGRMAAGLSCYLDPASGRYVGFDPVAQGIDWCRAAFAAYPHFRFEAIDVFNEHYHQDGALLATQYRFPAEDSSIDFAIATSVFTHLYFEEIWAYLKESARVLKPGGRLFSTFFLYDGECPARLPNLPHLDFTVRHGVRLDQWHVKNYPPLAAVAYHSSTVTEMIARTMRREAKVLPGRWRGGPGPFFQDVVLA